MSLFAADAGLATQGLRDLARLRGAGVNVHWRHRLVAVIGKERASRVVIAPSDRARTITIEADAVVTGDGFWPESGLALLLGCRATGDGVQRDDTGATSQPDVFVVGEAGGFGGARIARLQGEAAGSAAAIRLEPERSGGHAVS